MESPRNCAHARSAVRTPSVCSGIAKELALLLVAALTLTPVAWAQQAPPVSAKSKWFGGYQPFAFGLDIGNYKMDVDPAFVDTSMPGDPSSPATQETEHGFSGAVYLELYPFDHVGFGLRGLHATNSQRMVQGGTKSGVCCGELVLSAALGTMQLVLAPSDTPLRLVLIGGAGKGSLEWSPLSGSLGEPVSQSGSVQLVGAFLNLGGEKFHVRAGYHMIRTGIDAKSSLGSDGSGSYAYASCGFLPAGDGAGSELFLFLTIACAALLAGGLGALK